MLTLLRHGSEDDAPAGAGETLDAYAPVPGLEQVADLAERVRTAGVSAEVRTTGAPRTLPQGMELCAFRVVQESLTNMIKHVPSADASVRIEYRPRELVVTVADNGRSTSRSVRAEDAPRSGHGLIGMRERARLYGGTVDAGPQAEGGFRVRLTLPVSSERSAPEGGRPPA